MEKQGDYIKLNLTPLYDITSAVESGRTNWGRMEISSTSTFIWVWPSFILLLACINFMNLSTAHSASRAKEVGIRKVLGSPRIGLMLPFISESVLLSFFAMLAAVLMAWALLPMFNSITGKSLSITGSTLGVLLPAIIGITGIVGLLAGSYLAFFLSAFNPIKVLKGQTAAGFKGNRLRSLLVVFQFSIFHFPYHRNAYHIQSVELYAAQPLGFNRSQVLLVKHLNALNKQGTTFKQEILRLPGVASASLSSFVPTGHRRWTNYVSANNNTHQTEFWPVDEDYLRTMNMSLDKGKISIRHFHPTRRP